MSIKHACVCLCVSVLYVLAEVNVVCLQKNCLLTHMHTNYVFNKNLFLFTFKQLSWCTLIECIATY